MSTWMAEPAEENKIQSVFWSRKPLAPCMTKSLLPTRRTKSQQGAWSSQSLLPCIAKEKEQVELGKHSLDCNHSKHSKRFSKAFSLSESQMISPCQRTLHCTSRKGTHLYDKGPSDSKELGQRSIYVPAGPRLPSPVSKYLSGEVHVEKFHYTRPIEGFWEAGPRETPSTPWGNCKSSTSQTRHIKITPWKLW